MYQHTDNLGFLLNKATRQLKWEFDRRLKEYELTTPQWSVLIDLAVQANLGENIVSPASVAERLNMDRPTISGVIERLVKKGLIQSEPNPKDRRYQVLKLKPSAEQLLPRLENISNEVIDLAIQGLEKEEQQKLKIYLTKIICNLSDSN